ncbi:hypothetical protein ABIC28_000031 [Rhodococcus sp. PvR044]|jgi:hypothetical protein|uniref:hypothetical protein n=1 Tax=Rhodococcus TaxID=1827 RepID=UPI000BCE15E8|nr:MULTISPECIES: hypothetical protein [Rhodococcus]MBP1162499.1 hypothetical protein [Rhodococcus sp. PvR099]MCZ4555185.1 hypothetical protein [Rhodococcus maanshanensis]PTR45212.1 hypothetical protein C8K38_102352 [Rhodococcus sp. OK611]SNX89547.1 hypothetical protein SAMN05447004_102352 [Rhodococcus sp. OK270]
MGDARARPRPVDVAYGLWLVCAALLVLFGLLALTSPGTAIREQLVEHGANPDSVDEFIVLLRGSGAVSLLTGLGVGLMAGPTRAGDPRFRRAVVALSAVFFVLQLGLLATGLGQVPTLLVSLLALVASVLVYLRSSAEWFAGE